MILRWCGGATVLGEKWSGRGGGVGFIGTFEGGLDKALCVCVWGMSRCRNLWWREQFGLGGLERPFFGA